MRGAGIAAQKNWETYIFSPIRVELSKDPDYLACPREMFCKKYTAAWQAWCESQKAQLKKQLAAAEASKATATCATDPTKQKNRLQEARSGNLVAKKARVSVDANASNATAPARLAKPTNRRPEVGRGSRAVGQKLPTREPPIRRNRSGAYVFDNVGRRGDGSGDSDGRHMGEMFRLSSNEKGEQRARGRIGVSSHSLFRLNLSTPPENIRHDAREPPPPLVGLAASGSSASWGAVEAQGKGKGKLRADAVTPQDNLGRSSAAAGSARFDSVTPQESLASEKDKHGAADSNDVNNVAKVVPVMADALENGALCPEGAGGTGGTGPSWTTQDKAAHNLRLAQFLNSLREQGNTEIDQAQIVKIALGSYVP